MADRHLARAAAATASAAEKLDSGFQKDWDAVLLHLHAAAGEIALAGNVLEQGTSGTSRVVGAAMELKRETHRFRAAMERQATLLAEWREGAGIRFDGYLHRGCAAPPPDEAPAQWEA